MDIRKRKFFREGSKIQFINNDKTFFNANICKLQWNCIGVIINVNQHNYRILNEEENVQFIYVMEDKAVMYNAKVIAYKLNDRLQFVLLTTPEIVNKIERRKHHRVTALVNVKYSFLPHDSIFIRKDDVSALYFKRMKKTFSVDISTGGLNLITYHNNDEVKQAIVTMKINAEEITVLCNVIRFDTGDGINVKTALEFIDIANEDREIIRDYVDSRLKQVQISI